MREERMKVFRFLTLAAACSFLLLPALGRQNHHRITAKEIAALKTAILDEIYDYGFEDEYTDISLLTPSGYELGLYVRPNVDNGEGQVIYKLPVGEVARIFQLNGDLAILIRDPRDKCPPTSSSTLTLYLRDEDICADKRNWIHEMLLIDPHPSNKDVLGAVARERKRKGTSQHDEIGKSRQ
jgi:hypothetical protein